MTDADWPPYASDEYAAHLMANPSNPTEHGAKVGRELSADDGLRAHENSRAYRSSLANAYFRAGVEAGHARLTGKDLEAFMLAFIRHLDIG